MTEKNDKEVKVNVEIDDEWLDWKVAEKTKEKDEKITELTDALTTIAEKELNAKCEKYGIDKNLGESEKIDLIKRESLNRSNTALLNQFQTGNNDSEFSNDTEQLSANSEYDLVVELEKRASNNDLTAKKLLAEMTAKVCEKSHEWEFDGTGKDLYRKAKGTPQEQAEIRRKKQQWRMIK